ncbi:MAG: pyrroline-5-carboxylate reductase [Gammaproteobacteria bacterium]|nr:pyrroline-5-carboxylate reductase [Gammaproteobacteria bacterium]
MKSKTLAFIGCGNMAASLINGLVADGYDPTKIIASDPDSEKLAHITDLCGINSTTDNSEAVEFAQVVVMAVKPQALEQIANGISLAAQKTKPLIISIAAGVLEQDLENWLGGDIALVRTMPNTPAMIQVGATALHANPRVNTEQKDLAETILRAVGLTLWVEDESMIDAVTALSGSGPAYFFLVMEAMESAAAELGLPTETAHLLTLQTALGAARMAMESSDMPATLRERVTSPGGTTEAALQTFEDNGLRDIFMQALTKARDRSTELSNLLGSG